MCRKTPIILFLIFVCLSCLSCRRAYHDISIFEAHGLVFLERGAKTLKAEQYMKLKSQDILNVESDSYSRLCLDDAIFAYMHSDSVASVDSSHQNKLAINLQKGEFIIEVNKHLNDNESFNVNTPNTQMGIRGTAVAIRCIPDKDGSVRSVNYVLEGHVDILLADGETILLEAGEGWSVKTDAAGNTTESEKVGLEQFDFDNDDIGQLMTKFSEKELVYRTFDKEKYITKTNNATILFSIDTSSSIFLKGKDLLLRSAHCFINALNQNLDHAAIHSFTTRATENCTLTNDISALRSAINSLQWDDGLNNYSGTDTAKALDSAINVLSESCESNKCIILFTDGKDTSTSVSFSDIADTAKSEGIRVYVVVLDNKIPSHLSELTNLTGGICLQLTNNVLEVCDTIMDDIRLLPLEKEGVSGDE